MIRTRWRPPLGDLGIAFGLLAADVLLAGNEPSARPMDVWGWLLTLVSALGLIWRQRYPVWTLVAVATSVVVYYPVGYPDTPVGLSVAVAVYTVANRTRRATALACVAGIVAGLAVMSALNQRDDKFDPRAMLEAESGLAIGAMLLIVAALGEAARNRRAYVAAVEERAAAAERGREEAARRRATEERLRIARDLHDVLAHQMSLINVQAGAALHRRDDPETAYRALEAIKAASKDTLRELRAVLGVLRQADTPATTATTDTTGQTGEAGGQGPDAPVPSLARLGDLLAATTAAGLPVRLESALPEGPEGSLPAPVELAAYRIVQEALTNAVRHARASTATVRIVRDTGPDTADGTGDDMGDAVIVQIDDDGIGPAGPEALERGNGLRGMRERAAMVGGEVTAGPGPGGGFRVRARLPLDAPPRLHDDPDDPDDLARVARDTEGAA